MNKFLKIAGVQITGFMKSSSNVGGKKITSKILFVLLMGVLFIASGFYSFSIYAGLPLGYKDIMLYIMTVASVVVIFIFSITTAQGQLFNFKDFDLLMSFPIPRNQVFLAKIISFVSLNFMYQSIFVLPALAIYGYFQRPGILFYLFGLIGLLFLTLIPLTLASMLALFIRKISGNGRFKVLLANLGTFLLMAGIFVVSIMVPSMNESAVSVLSLTQLLQFLKTYLFPVYWYVNACTTGNVFYFIGNILVCLLAFGAFILFFSKTFIEINGQAQDGFKVKNFKLRSTKTNSALSALFKKEIMKIFANAMYFFNLAVGQVMLVIGGLYLVFNKSQIALLFQELGISNTEYMSLIFGLVCSVVCLFALMTPTSSVSISLEGKQWWITKTIPVKTEIIFLSKILVNAVIIWVPSVIGYLLVAFAFGFSFFEMILGCGLILAVGMYVGLIGVAVNLRFAKLVFDREIIVIKQSMSPFITIISGLIIGVLLIFGFANLSSFMSSFVIVALYFGGFVILDVAIWFYLKTVGIRQFNKLV